MLPRDAAHQLRLARARSGSGSRAACPAGRARVVVLDERDLDPELGPGVALEGLDQEAARVAVDLGLDQDDAVEPVSSRCGISRGDLAVLALVVLAVLAGADRPPPLLVVAVPVDGPLDALARSGPRPPSRGRSSFVGGERVAAVVAGAVGDVLDQRLVGAGQRDDPLDHLDVRQLVGPADVVGLARPRRARARCRSPRQKSSTKSQLRTCAPSP